MKLLIAILSFALGALSYHIAVKKFGYRVVDGSSIDLSGLDKENIEEFQQLLKEFVESYLENNAKK